MPKSIFRGWWLVLASMLALSTSAGPFALASLGVFMKPFSEEFGWSRVEISWSFSILAICTAVSITIVGRLVDVFGPRKVVISSLFALGVCLLAIPLLVTELWQLLFIYFLMGTIGAGSNSISYMPAIAAWFIRHRGLAMGLAVSGIGLGYAYVPVLVQSVSSHYGWRMSYYALASIIFIVSIPLVHLLVSDSPAAKGLMPDGIDQGEIPKSASKTIGVTTRQALRTREFWMIAIIFLLISFAMYGLVAHLVPMLTDRGVSPASSALAASVLGAHVFIGRILVGFLIDKVFAPYVALAAFTLSALGVAAFALQLGGAAIYIAAALVGVTIGAETDLLAYLASRYFGLREFGMICGLQAAAYLCGTATGPVAFGLGFEWFGSYTITLIVALAFVLLGILLTANLKPFPDWNQPAEGSGN